MRQLLLDAGARVTVEHVASWRDIELADKIINGTVPAQSLNSDATQLGDGKLNPEIIDCFLWTATYNAVPEIVKRCLDTIDWPIDEAQWHYILMQPFRFANVPKDDRTERLKRDCFDCLKLLLEHDVNPDVTMNGNTVLHHLATSDEPTEADRMEFAKILLDSGASLMLRDTGTLRSTPLGWACRWGRIELVRLYLERGAPVEEPDAEEWATPLARAESNGHTEIAQPAENQLSRIIVGSGLVLRSQSLTAFLATVEPASKASGGFLLPLLKLLPRLSAALPEQHAAHRRPANHVAERHDRSKAGKRPRLAPTPPDPVDHGFARAAVAVSCFSVTVILLG